MDKFLKSFVFAVRGIKECFRSERNFKVHTVAALLALLLAFVLKLSATEWCLILLVIALVLSAEIINTAVEKIADFVEPNQNEKIRIIKDMTAGMVLITAIGAMLVGVIIFLPKLWGLVTAII